MVNSYYEKISQTKSSPSEFDQPHNTPVKDWWILWRDFTNIYSHHLSSPSEFDQLSKSCKNTWVTLTTFLGCLNCINVTKECYQIGLSNEVLSLFSSLVVKLSLQDLFGYIPTTPMQQRKSSVGRCQSQQETRQEIMIYV